MELKAIAKINTDFKEKFGLPRQSGLPLFGEIIFEKEYRRTEALRGIEGYSHLWLLWGFDKVCKKEWRPTVRPPRLGGNERVGVFASRSPFRPNPIGLTVVKIEKIDYTVKDGPKLIVSGIDMVDGTPIYDIKPYVPHADCVTGAKGGYSDDRLAYALNIIDETKLLEILPKEKKEGLMATLSEDPRPAYQEDGREYGLSFAGYEIKFKVINLNLYVLSIDKE